MKLFTLFNLFLTVCLFGCLSTHQTAIQTIEPETKKSEPLTTLELSAPKTTYTAQEAIPLKLNIQNGKFDLLVPFSAVSTQSAFRELTVKDSDGDIIRIKTPVPQANTLKTLYQDGKSVRCVQGFDMKAGTTQTVSLENLKAHYPLQPGSYTVKVTLLLEVYREFLADQHPQVIELEREIREIQNSTNPQFTADVKQEAIKYTQDQIDLIQEKYKDELQNIYLPLKSLRGKTSLESNTISVTIK